jgi:hypothetical protein
VRIPLAAHFEGRDPIVRRTFRRWVAAARAFGSVTVYAQKTRIVFMTRVRFSGATIRRGHVNGSLWLKRRAEHPRIVCVEKLGRADYVHTIRLERPEDVDAALERLMGEAYAIGQQDHPGGGRARRRGA